MKYLTDMYVVEDDSLTVDNKEFEFSNSWTMPKSNHVQIPKTSKTNFVQNKRGHRTTRNRRSLMHSEEEKEHSGKSENIVKTLSESQNTLSTGDTKCVGDILPKRILETDDNFKSKCNSPFSNVRRRKSTQKVIHSIKKCNQTKNGKRVLRSSLQNPVSKNTGIDKGKNCTQQDNTGECGTSDSEKINKKCSDSESKEHKIDGTVQEAEKTQTLKRSIKSGNLTTSQLKVGKNKDILKRKLSRIKDNSARKNVLQSTDQDTSELENNSTKNVDTTETSTIIEKIPQKKKGPGKSLTNFKKGKKPFSEIKIVLEPIDISKLNEKLPSDTKKILCRKSLVKRKSDLAKTTNKAGLDINNQRKLVVESRTTKNEKSVACNTNGTLITSEKNIETSKTEVGIEETSVTPLEDKKCGKLMEKIINKTDSQIIITEVKSKKSDIKSKEIKFTKLDTDGLNESKTESPPCNDSFTENGSTAEELGKPLLCCSETSDITQDPTDNIQNTNLAIEGPTEIFIFGKTLNGDINEDADFVERYNLAENSKDVEKTSEKTNSLEIKACNVALEHFKDKLKKCDLQKNSELIQITENDKELLGKSDERDENPISKCNLKEKDLEINSNESQNTCDQKKDKETLETADTPIEGNQEFLLDSENKINLPDSHNSKVEVTDFSNLLKKEEDISIINHPLLDKVESPKCLDNQNELLNADTVDTSKNLPVDNFKNFDPSSESKIILDVIFDKTKEDLVIDFRLFTDDSLEEAVNVQDNITSDESTQTLDTGLEQNEKENNKFVTPEKPKQTTEIHNQASLESISSILTTENASGEEIPSSVSPNEEYSASLVEPIIRLSSELETGNDSPSILKQEEHNCTKAKLPEKKRSLSCEEPTKEHENIPFDSSHVFVAKQESAAEEKTPVMNLTYPLTNVRKRGRPKKRKRQLHQKNKPKQETADNMNLLSKNEIFKEQVRPRGRSRKKSLDDIDLLNESKSRGKPRGTSTDNTDLLQKNEEHANNVQQPRPKSGPGKGFTKDVDLLNNSKEHSDNVPQPRPRGRPRKRSLHKKALPNNTTEQADNVQQPPPSGTQEEKSVENVDLLGNVKESTEVRLPRPRGRPRRNSVDDMDLLNRINEYNEKKKRSKSVARSMLEIRRKPNERNKWRSSDDWISSHTRNKDSPDDNISLLSRYEKYKDKMQSKHAEVPVKLENQLNNKGSPKKSPRTDSKQSTIQRDIYIAARSIKGNDFKVGEITWAQIGSHPYWPCLITKEPGTKYYKKIFQNKRYQREMYHVHFFGDNGRRAWIKKRQLLRYCNQDDLKVIRDKLKSETKVIPSIYSIKGTALQKWQAAVNEAEELKSKNVKDRLRFFTEMFLNKQKESNSEDPVSKTSPVPVKRKSNEIEKTEDESLPPQNQENSLEIIPEKKQKKDDADNVEKEVVEDAPASQAEQIDNVPEAENILRKMSLRRQIDEISEIDSKTSSDNITDIDVALNAMEAQKALYKRNNLFRGISRDKVCQYCCKPGEVLKCRGRCNGLYHVSCSLKILLDKPVRGRRKKNHNDGRLRKNRVFHSIKAENSNSPNNDTQTENPLQRENCNPSDTEEQVQIITVPSSVYNTPPRNNFPPDFKNMSLAEQIDFKMKEIMRKFEYKTVYTDTYSMPVSMEGSALPQTVRLGSSNASLVSVSRDVNISSVSKNSTGSTRDDKRMDHKLTALAKKKLFIGHVTADSENVKSDTSLEESFDSSELDPKNFKCGFCMSDLYPYCFVCHKAVSKKGSSIRQRCSIYQCGRFYHPECLKVWPQTQWSLIQTTRHKDTDEDMDSFVCPLHVCHTCVSDDPRAATSRCSGDKIVKCLRCPSTYHSSNLCVPAGTAILSSSQIICPRHRQKSKLYTINTTWCFLCSEGGNLICCETCPTSVHPECLPVNLTDDDKFICEDCESGRLPLYDEIVWVKLGKFRWWPALILFPNEVPDNVRNMKHNIGEFVVKFFGTYDYYWVNRGRSFLFQEGDTGQCNSVRKKVDVAFNRSVEEAVVAHKLKKEFKLNLEVEPVTSLKPPPYIRIKVNRPVGNVRHMDLDLSSTNACECDPNKPHPCGPESDCLNRLLLTECDPDVCPAGTRCKNQSFEKREYPPLVPYKTQGRGWGLKTLAPIKKGQFVIEYVGELIDIEEYQRRIQKMHEQKEENYYFLTIDKDRIIDAGPKGNAARFMNHCCQPNCETQKWTVNGDTRVGLFATEDIPADTELTFNYNLECVGKEKKVCRCGAPNCSGFIGVKAKQDTETRKPKKSIKKKVFVEPVVLPPCFICGKEGLVVSCNNKVCNKTYHQKCLKSTTEQTEGKFICPWHNCNVCSKRTIRCCVKCINSYCPLHSDGNIRYDNLLGFVCTTHDSTSVDDLQSVSFKRKRSDSLTEETAVTSTTSDETDDSEDGMSLLERLSRLERFDSKPSASTDVESDNESIINRPSTSVENQFVFDTDCESQDEGVVSSATVPEAGEGVVVKRKRGRPSKRDQLQKKIRLSQERNPGITASHDNSSELTCRENNLENR